MFGSQWGVGRVAGLVGVRPAGRAAGGMRPAGRVMWPAGRSGGMAGRAVAWYGRPGGRVAGTAELMVRGRTQSVGCVAARAMGTGLLRGKLPDELIQSSGEGLAVACAEAGGLLV